MTAPDLDARLLRDRALGLAITYSPTLGWGEVEWPPRAGASEEQDAAERADVPWLGEARA